MQKITNLIITYSIVIVLFLISVFSAFFYIHYNKKIETLSIEKLKFINQIMIEKVSNYLMPAIKMSETSAYLFENYVLYYTLPLQLEFYTLSLVKSFPQLSASYFGDNNGNFIMTKRLIDQTFETTILDPITKKTQIKNYNLFNKKISFRTQSNVLFDPRLRPWFSGAKERQYWTDVYKFYSDKNLGVTASYPIFNQEENFHGVFGIDIKLEKIEKFLSENQFLKKANVFIIDQNHKIIISPKTTHLNNNLTPNLPLKLINKWIVERYIKKKQNNKFYTILKFNYDNKQFYAIYSSFPKKLGNNWQIVTLLEEKNITLNKTTNHSLLISLIVFIGLFIAGSILFILNKIKQLLPK